MEKENAKMDEENMQDGRERDKQIGRQRGIKEFSSNFGLRIPFFINCDPFRENLIYYCRPQTKFGEGDVFTRGCQEFCPQLVAAVETRTVGKRAAGILLECFLVNQHFL